MPKCVYYKCSKTSEHVSMFRFPVNDKARLLMWIKNSGNEFLLSLTNSELSRRYICETHFHPDCIHKSEKRSRLLGPAVPIPYQRTGTQAEPVPSTSTGSQAEPVPNTSTGGSVMDIDAPAASPERLKVRTPTKVYVRSCESVPIVENKDSRPTTPHIFGGPYDMPTPRLSRKCLQEQPRKRLSRKCIFQESDKDTPRTKKLKRSASGLLKKTRAQHSKIYRLESKIKENEQSQSTDTIKNFSFTTEASKTLALMQFRKENERTPWTEKERKLCLAFFYKSPSGYEFLRRQGVILAAPSTIRKWLSKTNCLPGFCNQVFYNIKTKFEDSTMKEKACVVAFDEMQIMEKLEYSKKYDCIEGLEDLGGSHRTNKPAKSALVFVARGLFSNWKLPIAYFLSHTNVKADTLQLLVKATINKLFDSGLLPKATVCDQASTNQKIYKDLGASKNNPFFYCNGRKIFALFDAPHLIKNIRNNFLENDYIINDRERVSFQDILKTYEIDKSSKKSRTLLKITEKHLRPNSFQRMNVSLATQLFSHSVAAAVRTAKDLGQLDSPTAYHTGDFVETVNNMFDGLNSRSKFEKNAYRCALTKNNTHARQALIKGKKMFENIKKISVKINKNNVAKTTQTRLPCFDGIVQTITATLQLFEEESTQDDIKYMITSKLNQDVIENLFALLRQKGGFNRNPSAKVLRAIFRSVVVNSFIKLPNTKNCLSDDNYYIEINSENPSTQTTQEEFVTTKQSEDIEDHTVASTSADIGNVSRDTETSLSNYTEKVTLEMCSVTYFAGYLAKSCIDKFKCEECEKSLLEETDLTDEKQMLIVRKTFGFLESVKLRTPSALFNDFVDSILEKYSEKFENMIHRRNLAARLFNFLSIEASDFTKNKSENCKEHVDFIIKHLIWVKINFYCKCSKRNTSECKPNPKLKILKNM